MHADKRKEAEAFIDKVIVPRRAVPSSDPEAARARDELDRKDLELARRELVAAGLDTERLDKLAADRSKDRKKLAEDTRRRAVDASAVAADRLKDLVPVILPIDPVDTVIDEVTFIRGYAGQGRRGEWNIGPSDNWAKYRLDSGTDDPTLPGRLSFFLLWQNRQDNSIVLMARPNLVVNAHISCEADGNGTGSWFGITSQARATVRARTTVWNMDSSISSIVHDEVLGVGVARGNFWGDDSNQSITFNEVLPASGVSIAPQAWSLIEVELVTEWQRLHGSVTVDAEAGSRRIAVPQIVLTEVGPPEPPPTPISLQASVSYGSTGATVQLSWTGATASSVDIYINGVLYGTSANDGQESIPRAPGNYVFRVCNPGSAVCSTDVNVTVNP